MSQAASARGRGSAWPVRSRSPARDAECVALSRIVVPASVVLVAARRVSRASVRAWCGGWSRASAGGAGVRRSDRSAACRVATARAAADRGLPRPAGGLGVRHARCARRPVRRPPLARGGSAVHRERWWRAPGQPQALNRHTECRASTRGASVAWRDLVCGAAMSRAPAVRAAPPSGSLTRGCC